VRRALSADPAQRPTAKELYDYLHQAVTALIAPPKVMRARLATPLSILGSDVRIEWQIDSAQIVAISAGNGQQQIAVDLAEHPDGFTFRPDKPGAVSVTAMNSFGTATVNLGELTIYDPGSTGTTTNLN
jgi:hypothetical protein